MKILVINGPNLNLLGKREPGIYGNRSFESYYEQLTKDYPEVEFAYFQSNHEGAIIDEIHGAYQKFDGIVINPGAFTHYSYAILDALKSVDIPTAEIHISDVDSREEFRKISVIRPACCVCIYGRGYQGYVDAVKELADKICTK